MASDDPEDNPLQRWLDAEQRLSTEPDREDPGEAAERDVPTAPEVDTGSVDAETARYFWAAVVLANVGVAGISIGLMLIGFRGEWTLGGGLLLLGALALARTYRVYRDFRADAEG